jgi:hypothetical protein
MSARQRCPSRILRAQRLDAYCQITRMQSPLDIGCQTWMLVYSARSRRQRLQGYGWAQSGHQLLYPRFADSTWMEGHLVYQELGQHAFEPDQKLR